MNRTLVFCTALSFSIFAMATSLPNAHALASGAAKARQALVTMYVMPNCGYCAKARAYFAENQITVQELDVSSSESIKSAWQELGGHGTPFTVIGKQHIEGFQPEKFQQALHDESQGDLEKPLVF